MSHRIREAMRDGKLAPMGGSGGVIEADETYFGKAGSHKIRTRASSSRSRLSMRRPKSFRRSSSRTSSTTAADKAKSGSESALLFCCCSRSFDA
jgi:hypothetical protein